MTTLTSGLILNSSHFRNQDTILNRLQCQFFDKNTINVSAGDIDLDKIVIESLEENKVVFKNGKKTSKIKNQYGGDNFKVFYKNKLLGQAGIFKTNWWHTHDYFFKVFKTCTNIAFEFEVIGPDHRSLYFKHFDMDSSTHKSTETFYNSKGPSGQVNVEYYDNKGKVITDEIWIDDTLVTMNLYSNGNWYKNYDTKKYDKDTKYNLLKINNSDSLVYVYQIIKDNKTTNNRIAIKN
ncbi:MAG: hypothetical protein SFY56_15140 [Bacteroidota bacterium]|nr:hypothetical protein [Bacteroidota bacterium]